MITVYGIPNCDMVKKSLSWFETNKIDYRFHNFKTHGISHDKLSTWINNAGLDVVVNKRSTTWRNLAQKMQLALQDKNKAIAILMAETNIIKRPVVESENALVIGFDLQEYKNKFVS